VFNMCSLRRGAAIQYLLLVCFDPERMKNPVKFY
jgi:hypothetical protein